MINGGMISIFLILFSLLGAAPVCGGKDLDQEADWSEHDRRCSDLPIKSNLLKDIKENGELFTDIRATYHKNNSMFSYFTKLKTLATEVDDESLVAFISFVSQHQTLKELRLYAHKIGQNGVMTLVESLIKHNKTLGVLRIYMEDECMDKSEVNSIIEMLPKTYVAYHGYNPINGASSPYSTFHTVYKKKGEL